MNGQTRLISSNWSGNWRGERRRSRIFQDGDREDKLFFFSICLFLIWDKKTELRNLFLFFFIFLLVVLIVRVMVYVDLYLDISFFLNFIETAENSLSTYDNPRVQCDNFYVWYDISYAMCRIRFLFFSLFLIIFFCSTHDFIEKG